MEAKEETKKLFIEEINFDEIISAKSVGRNALFEKFLKKNKESFSKDMKILSELKIFKQLDIITLPGVFEKIITFIDKNQETKLGFFLKDNLRYFSLFLKEHFIFFREDMPEPIKNILKNIDEKFEEIPSNLNIPLNLPDKDYLPPQMQNNVTQKNWSKIILDDPSRMENEISFFVKEYNESKVASVRIHLILDEINLKNTKEALCYASCDFHPTGNLHADHFQSSKSIIIRQKEMISAMNLNNKFCAKILEQANAIEKNYFSKTFKIDVYKGDELEKGFIYVKKLGKKLEYQYINFEEKKFKKTLEGEMSESIRNIVEEKKETVFLKKLKNNRLQLIKDIKKIDKDFPSEEKEGLILGTKLFFMDYHNCIDNIWLITAEANSGSEKRDAHPLEWIQTNKYNNPLLKKIGVISKDCILYTAGSVTEKKPLCVTLKKCFRETYNSELNVKNFKLNGIDKKIKVKVEGLSFHEIPEGAKLEDVEKIKNKNKKKEFAFAIKLTMASNLIDENFSFEESTPTNESIELFKKQVSFSAINEIVKETVELEDYKLVHLPTFAKLTELSEGCIYLKISEEKFLCSFLDGGKNPVLDIEIPIKLDKNFNFSKLDGKKKDILEEINNQGYTVFRNKKRGIGENFVENIFEELKKSKNNDLNPYSK